MVDADPSLPNHDASQEVYEALETKLRMVYTGLARGITGGMDAPSDVPGSQGKGTKVAWIMAALRAAGRPAGQVRHPVFTCS